MSRVTMSRKHRPRKHRPQTLKMQTSKLQAIYKTYTFDKNNLRVVLVFPIVFGFWDADFAFFFSATTLKTWKLQFVSTVFLNECFAHYA